LYAAQRKTAVAEVDWAVVGGELVKVKAKVN
jgi:hypothetical protein